MGYPGSKGGNGTWQQIISRVPKCNTFVELMAGTGILSEKLKATGCSTVTNDIDSSLPADFHYHYLDLIGNYDCTAHGHTVIYCDPPYLFSTRRGQRKLYKNEWTSLDHEVFLSRVLTVKVDCMISHYPCKLYNDRLQSWRSVTFQSMTHKGLATEKLWMNFPPPTLLQAGHTVGNDCWRRQGLKRKTTRLINKILALPADEKASILSAINNQFL